MKKFQLFTTLSFASLCLVSCNTTSKNTQEVMVGAYSQYNKINSEDDSLFNAVMESYDNLKLTPMKVAHQVVAGTNYKFKCVDAKKRKVEVVIYCPLPGNGKAKLLSIDGKAMD